MTEVGSKREPLRSGVPSGNEITPRAVLYRRRASEKVIPAAADHIHDGAHAIAPSNPKSKLDLWTMNKSIVRCDLLINLRNLAS